MRSAEEQMQARKDKTNSFKGGKSNEMSKNLKIFQAKLTKNMSLGERQVIALLVRVLSQ